MQTQAKKGVKAGYKRREGRLDKTQGRLQKAQRQARKGAKAGYKRHKGGPEKVQRQT